MVEIVLPSWSDCCTKFEQNGDLTPLEWLIYEFEPSDDFAGAEFRDKLTALIEELRQ